jgi:class 3 adenylate cyclase/tetratricopeptide (TPR) repeat protein
VRAKDKFCSSCGAPIAAAQAPDRDTASPTSASLQVPTASATALAEQRKVVTILFADLSGSTVLGEKLDAEDLRGVLGAYFAALARQIQRYEGTIDKYIGDAIMAVFGAPLSHEDDAERALHAALAMQAAIQRLNDDLERRHGVRLALRIGINTGEVVAGMLAGDVQRAYTVVGDAVNTAQRFESVAPLNEVLVSESTYRLAAAAFEFERLPPVTLKGKAQPVAAFRLMRRRDEEVPPEASPLVGRVAELARLQGEFGEARAGRGRIVHVSGEAGVGKSRLLAEFKRPLGNGVQRISARCASYEMNTPYALLAGLLRSAWRIRETDDENTASIAITQGFMRFREPLEEGTHSLLLEVLGYRERSPLEPERKQAAIVGTVRGLLRRVATVGTLVITAEDMHSIDPASTSALAAIVGEIDGLPVLLITTGRPGWTPAWKTAHLDLEPLSTEEARELIGEILETPVAESVTTEIAGRAGGNPFFIEELSRQFRAGAIAGELPQSIQEVLEARLERLPEGPHRVARDAAVIGQTFAYRLLERLLPDEPLGVYLALLEQEAFVTPRAIQPERTYGFRQGLIRDVAYQTQLLSRRRHAHALVGAAIEDAYAGRLDEFVDALAFHYERSDNDERAIFWLRRAGDRARSLFANSEALALYNAALARAPTDDGESRAAIHERLADVLRLVGRYDEALAHLWTGRHGAVAPATAARLSRKIAMTLTSKGAYGEALDELDVAATALGGAVDVESARIARERGEVHLRRGDYAAARAALTEAVETATRLGADDVVAGGLKMLGNVANNLADLPGALDLYRRSLAVNERIDDRVGIGDLHSNIGGLLRRMGQFDEALEELEASLALRRRIGHLWGVAAAQNNIGELYRGRSEPARGIPAYAEAISIWDTIGAPEAAVALMNRGAARLEAGDAAAGRADLVEARRRFEAMERTKFLPSVYRDLARAELASGDLAAASAAADRALALARAAKEPHNEAMVKRVLAEIALARGDRNAARTLLEESVATFERLSELDELARTRAVLARVGD